MTNLKYLNLTPQGCYRDSEPINLYHKVGHGTLDMYVLSPARDSREVKEFMQKWNNNDSKLFAYQKHSKDFTFPIPNLVSICALLIWQPASPTDTITRILYPGSTPQQKVFEGLDRIKHLACIKYPVCTENSLSPSMSITALKQKSEKITPPDLKAPKRIIENKAKEKSAKDVDVKSKPENKAIENNIKNGDISNGQGTDATKPQKLDDKTKTKSSTDSKAKDDQKLKQDNRISKVRSESQQRRTKPVEKKASPTTPKKTLVNGEVSKTKVSNRVSPQSTPAKSTKDANNRKVVESKSRQPALGRPQPKSQAEKKDLKPERKPVAKKAKEGTANKVPGSPLKKLNGLPKSEAGVQRKAKLDKEGTTDSSTVSTPSADQDNLVKKDISKMTPEEIEQIKAQELAELKEEQEVVKEIEAVFRKGEMQDDKPSDLRKVKHLSSEEREPEEYLIIEKEVIEQVVDLQEDELQKHTRDSEESEKPLKVDEKVTAVEETDAIQPPATTDIKHEIKIDTTKKESTAEIVIPSTDILPPTSPEEADMFADKKISDKDADEKQKEVTDQNKAQESQPEEKVSGTVDSGATTTAPTLPEDERITLDEIKEDNGDQIIEEKHVKEDTKEKDVPVIHLPTKGTDAVSKLPSVAGIRLDRHTNIRDLVKTPDEVADLPVHEEVDIQNYDYQEDYKAAAVEEVARATDTHLTQEKDEIKEESELLPKQEPKLEAPHSEEKDAILKTDAESDGSNKKKDVANIKNDNTLPEKLIQKEHSAKSNIIEAKNAEALEKVQEPLLEADPQKQQKPTYPEAEIKTPVKSDIKQDDKAYQEKSVPLDREPELAELNEKVSSKPADNDRVDPETVGELLKDEKVEELATLSISKEHLTSPKDNEDDQTAKVEISKKDSNVSEVEKKTDIIPAKEVDVSKQEGDRIISALPSSPELVSEDHVIEQVTKERAESIFSIDEDKSKLKETITEQSGRFDDKATVHIDTLHQEESGLQQSTIKEGHDITENKEDDLVLDTKISKDKDVDKTRDVSPSKADSSQEYKNKSLDADKHIDQEIDLGHSTNGKEVSSEILIQRETGEHKNETDSASPDLQQKRSSIQLEQYETPELILSNKDDETKKAVGDDEKQVDSDKQEIKSQTAQPDNISEESLRNDGLNVCDVADTGGKATDSIDLDIKHKESENKRTTNEEIIKESVVDSDKDSVESIVGLQKRDIGDAKDNLITGKLPDDEKLQKDISKVQHVTDEIVRDRKDSVISETLKGTSGILEDKLSAQVTELGVIHATKEKEVVQSVLKDAHQVAQLDKKLQELKSKTTDLETDSVKEEVIISSTLDKLTHAEPVILPSDSAPESPMVPIPIKPSDFEKSDLGSKSPKEREEDVAKIVATVAEVLKSDAPLDELESKIPLVKYGVGSITSDLRETHITQQELPTTIDTESSNVTAEIEQKDDKLCISAFLEGEKKFCTDSADFTDLSEKPEYVASETVKNTSELLETTSKVIADIKSEKDESQNLDDADGSTVHRMLVTASSEDGGEETVICPPGSIIFSRSSESSGRSSPEGHDVTASKKIGQESIPQRVEQTNDVEKQTELTQGDLKKSDLLRDKEGLHKRESVTLSRSSESSGRTSPETLGTTLPKKPVQEEQLGKVDQVTGLLEKTTESSRVVTEISKETQHLTPTHSSGSSGKSSPETLETSVSKKPAQEDIIDKTEQVTCHIEKTSESSQETSDLGKESQELIPPHSSEDSGKSSPETLDTTISKKPAQENGEAKKTEQVTAHLEKTTESAQVITDVSQETQHLIATHSSESSGKASPEILDSVVSKKSDQESVLERTEQAITSMEKTVESQSVLDTKHLTLIHSSGSSGKSTPETDEVGVCKKQPQETSLQKIADSVTPAINEESSLPQASVLDMHQTKPVATEMPPSVVDDKMIKNFGSESRADHDSSNKDLPHLKQKETEKCKDTKESVTDKLIECKHPTEIGESSILTATCKMEIVANENNAVDVDSESKGSVSSLSSITSDKESFNVIDTDTKTKEHFEIYPTANETILTKEDKIADEVIDNTNVIAKEQVLETKGDSSDLTHIKEDVAHKVMSTDKKDMDVINSKVTDERSVIKEQKDLKIHGEAKTTSDKVLLSTSDEHFVQNAVQTTDVVNSDVARETEDFDIKKESDIFHSDKAGPSSVPKGTSDLTSPASSTEDLHLSGKSTPDIAEVERLKEIQEILKHEKHIPGSSTPPTVPASPVFKEKSQGQEIIETRTFAKSPETVTSLAEAKKVSESPAIALLKDTDIRSYTPGSDDYEYSDVSSGQASRAPNLPETGRNDSEDDDLPGSPTSVTSQVAHSRSPSHYEFDEDSLRTAAKVDPMSVSFYGALPDEPSDFKQERVLDEADLDFEKAIQEHRQARGEDLERGPSPSYLYEVTKAKYSSSEAINIAKETEESLHSLVTGPVVTENLMTSSFIGSELPTRQPGEKTTEDTVASWGKPLGLPSPAPPSDNKGTPKKEKKLPSNVTAKNKLNEDKRRSESPSKFERKSKKSNCIYVDLTYVPHHGNANYSFVEFFKRVRARYYVFSGIEPSREVYNALLEAKQSWEDKELGKEKLITYIANFFNK